MEWGWDDLIGISLVLVLGGGLATYAGIALRDRAAVRRSGARTEAKIIQQRFSENATRYQIRYTSIDDSEFTRWVAEPYFVENRHGTTETLTVAYHPDRPKKVFVPEALDSWRIDIALWAVIALATVMVVVVAVLVVTANV